MEDIDFSKTTKRTKLFEVDETISFILVRRSYNFENYLFKVIIKFLFHFCFLFLFCFSLFLFYLKWCLSDLAFFFLSIVFFNCNPT